VFSIGSGPSSTAAAGASKLVSDVVSCVRVESEATVVPELVPAALTPAWRGATSGASPAGANVEPDPWPGGSPPEDGADSVTRPRKGRASPEAVKIPGEPLEPELEMVRVHIGRRCRRQRLDLLSGGVGHAGADCGRVRDETVVLVVPDEIVDVSVGAVTSGCRALSDPLART